MTGVSVRVSIDNFETIISNAERRAIRINETTAAIMIETIQGEGGIRAVPLSFLEKIKHLIQLIPETNGTNRTLQYFLKYSFPFFFFTLVIY